MTREIIETGKTIELAVKAACEKLDVSEDDVNIEVLEAPKRGLLGLKSTPAKVRVTVELVKSEYAREFLGSVIEAMGLESVDIAVKEDESGSTLTMNGEDMGCIIGRHGDTLDALQYITNLVVNQLDGDYYRVTLDCGNFREKREKSLVALAERLSRQVAKYGRSVTLEPMNPYERRIIHSTVQGINDVTSASVGEEPNRCVVISSTNPVRQKRKFDGDRNRGRGGGGNYRGGKGGGNRDRNSGGGKRYNNDRDRGGRSDRPYNNSGPRRSPSTQGDQPSGESRKTSISDKDNTGALYGKIELD